MGQTSTVYGIIRCCRRARGSIDPVSLNRAALDSLPDTEDWPFLVRPMFALTESERVSIEYGTSLIHFAASYKEVEGEWAEWLDKFERLLGRIDGMSASVHLETEWYGFHFFEWHRSKESADAWPPVWKFGGGPRSFEEIMERNRPGWHGK